MGPLSVITLLLVCVTLPLSQGQAVCNGTSSTSNCITIAGQNICATLDVPSPSCVYVLSVTVSGAPLVSLPVFPGAAESCVDVSIPGLKSLCLQWNSVTLDNATQTAYASFTVTPISSLSFRLPSLELLQVQQDPCLFQCLTQCSSPSSFPPCSGHGYCISSSSCSCTPPYSGPSCSTTTTTTTTSLSSSTTSPSSQFSQCFQIPLNPPGVTLSPCVTLAFGPCNMTFALYADPNLQPISGTISWRSFPNFSSGSGSIVLVQQSLFVGCTATIALTAFQVNPTTSLASGNVTASVSCVAISASQTLSFSNVRVESGSCPYCFPSCVNGYCNAALNQCQCNAGWNGTQCDVSTLKSCPDNCSGNGVCNTSSGVCSCYTLYAGSNCGTNYRSVVIGVVVGVVGGALLILVVALIVKAVLQKRRQGQPKPTALADEDPNDLM